MRPAISWSDLRGRRVGVWGLGVEGRASLRKLRRLGVEPVLVDDRPSDEQVDGQPIMATDDGGLQALRGCDYVVKTPGKSRYDPAVRELEAAGVGVVGGLGLWLQEADRDRVVCITGTKGKSTTTAVAAHLLDRLGYRVLAAGNIGRPPYDPDVGDDYDYWVVETSSYQATDVAMSPPVTAVTSLHPDHLPWHRGDVETYYRDKLSLCHQPGARITVANGDSPLLRARQDQLAPAVRWVSLAGVHGPSATPGASMRLAATGASDASGAPGRPEAAWMEGLGLLGEHNRRNALIAQACLQELGIAEASDDEALAEAAKGFEHLSSRLTPVAELEGVLFVDDSLSTNVLPTLAAVDAFPDRRVALIVGGSDRGIDYMPLALGLAGRLVPMVVIVTESESAASLRAALKTHDLGPNVEVAEAGDLGQATRRGFAWARPDGVVLLSPAAPSFDRYRDYRDRAAAFVAAVASCR